MRIVSCRSRRTVTARIGPLLYRCLATIVELLVRRAQRRRALEAEVIALRSQVKVLRRQVSRSSEPSRLIDRELTNTNQRVRT